MAISKSTIKHKGYAPANAEAQCRGGGGAAGWLNEKFPKPTFFGYFMVQIDFLSEV